MADESGERAAPATEDRPAGVRRDAPFRRARFWIILAVVVAVIGGAALLWWLDARRFESTDNAFVDAHIVRLAPQVAGTLTQVADVDNRHVEAGRLLAVLTPSRPEAQLAEAQANVVAAEAEADRASAGVTAAIAARAAAADQARAPLANAVKAAQDLARYEQLQRIDRAAVAGQQLDAARAAARAAAAEAAAARRQIANADAQVEVARRAARVAGAAIGARRAQVRQANVTIDDLRITAPVAGTVTNRQVNLGSYVAPGTQLMAIVPDRMWVTANFKETQLARMRIGQPVTIEVDAYPDVEFHGRIDSFQRGAGQAFALLPPQNATGNYVKVVQRVPVRIEFVGNEWRRYPIGPGMSVVPTVKVR